MIRKRIKLIEEKREHPAYSVICFDGKGNVLERCTVGVIENPGDNYMVGTVRFEYTSGRNLKSIETQKGVEVPSAEDLEIMVYSQTRKIAVQMQERHKVKALEDLTLIDPKERK